MSVFRVFAKVKSKTGNEVWIREGLLRWVAATRKESCVVKYDLYETAEGGEFLLGEEYTDKAVFDAHVATEHLKGAVASLTPMMSGGLKIWKVQKIA